MEFMGTAFENRGIEGGQGLALTPIQVVGIGLDGAAGLRDPVRDIVQRAGLLVGSDRHLHYFPDHPAPRVPLTDFQQAFEQMQRYLAEGAIASSSSPGVLPDGRLIVVLTSGDPLFFGFGRLLLHQFPAALLTFHPHLSAIQLAFSRLKLPWQEARIVSLHGRSPDALIQCLQQGADLIAVLTDPVYTPGAIATLLLSLDVAATYQCWVCENLGGADEQIQPYTPQTLVQQRCAPLNVVILQRQPHAVALGLEAVPLLGIADAAFASFGDRPGLMTKREIRTLALGELALHPSQVVWDIGAGTGSVSIEIARLCPTSQVYAIEKTAAGVALIHQNCAQFHTPNVIPVAGVAPDACTDLPAPDRVFVGGSGGHLQALLSQVASRLNLGGVMVMAIATLEHLSQATQWLATLPKTGDRAWRSRLLQVQLARSLPVGSLTRLNPLNPVYLLRLEVRSAPSPDERSSL